MLKIAFATADGTAVDQHFGWCRRFDVYEVSGDQARLLETRLLPPAGDNEDNKIASRLDQVRDCAILNVCDIGGTAAARVVNAKVHPVKVPSGTSVEGLITRFQGVLNGTPPPWLRKVLRQHGQRTVGAWTPTGGVR